MKKNLATLIKDISTLKGIERIDQVKLSLPFVHNLNDIYNNTNVLRAAVESDDEDIHNATIVEILIEAGAKVDVKNPNCFTTMASLNFALSKPLNTLTIEKLLQYGANIDNINFLRLNESHLCHLIELFVKYGFDINKKDKHFKQNLLMRTVENVGESDVIKKILDLKANPNIVDDEGNSILMRFLKRMTESHYYSSLNFEIVRLLIDYGANPYFINNTSAKETNMTILMYLLRLRSDQVHKFLIEHIDNCTDDYINQLTSKNNTALAYAIVNSYMTDENILRKIIERSRIGLNVNIIDRLFIIPQKYIYKKLQILLEKGYVINMDNITIYLEKMVRCGNDDEYVEIIHYLLKLDATYVKSHSKCLIDAIERNNTKIICLLLNYGADHKYMRDDNHNDPTSFVSFLDFRKDSHLKIWSVILDIESQKKNMRKTLDQIPKSYGKLTLRPSSIFTRLMSLHWRLQQENHMELYQKMLKKDRVLVEYFGLNRNVFAWKISQYYNDVMKIFL